MIARNCLLLTLTITSLPLLLAAERSAAQATTGSRQLEEVIVTARRIEERLQDTPVSVSAFSAEKLDERLISTTEQLAEVTPNLSFTNATTLAGNNNSSNIFIRGVGQTDPTSTVDPGVGLYIDEVYMGQSIGGTMDLRDIHDVQVLRGPQGTLFGKNSVGGAILLTTVEPGDEFGGTVRAGVGSDRLGDLFLAVDAPFSDTMKSRFSFGTRRQDGYVTRIQTGEDLGDTNVWTATAKFAFTPSDRFRGKLHFDYTKTDENGNPFVFAASEENATFQRVASADAGCPGYTDWTSGPVPMIDDDRCANDFQNKGPYANNGTYTLASKLTNWGTSLHLAWDFTSEWSLKSITAYRELDWIGIRDADNTPLVILHTNYDSNGDQFSQELQLQYGGENLNGTVGAYYFRENVDDIVLVELNTPAPGIQQDSDNNKTRNHNWAVFTQWTYNATDALSLTLGGRFTEDTKGSIPDQFNYADPTVKYLPVVLYEDTFSNFSMTASVAYRFNDMVMTYLSYAEAFKGGGWNSHFNRPQTQAEQDLFQKFNQEEAQTFELGFKMDLVDNTLRLNGAIFTTDYNDLQFTYRVGVAPYLANAGDASIDGAELELAGVPTEAWIVDAGVGYLDSNVDSLGSIPPGAAIGVDVGNRLPYTPEWQFNLGIGYSGNIGGNWLIAPRVDFVHQDSSFWDANDTPEIAVDSAHSIVNAAVVFGPQDGPWKLRAYVKNATDELYSKGGNSSLTTGSGYAEIAYARPREYFLYFDWDF